MNPTPAVVIATFLAIFFGALTVSVCRKIDRTYHPYRPGSLFEYLIPAAVVALIAWTLVFNYLRFHP